MSIMIGMDVGGTSIKLGAWCAGERLGWRSELPVPASADPLIVGQQLAGYVTEFNHTLPTPATGLGIGSCGVIANGTIIQSPNTPWDELPLKQLLEERLEIPCFVINDADAFLMAGVSSLEDQHCIALGLILGTGIGTALWVRDRLYAGGTGISPEGGHITLNLEGAPANTGVPGSWESMAGRDALMRHYATGGGRDLSTPAEVANAALKGEPAALDAWAHFGRCVGAGLASLSTVLQPNYVLISGGMSRTPELFRPALDAALELYLWDAIPRPKIRLISEAEDIVARGAATHARGLLTPDTGEVD